MAANDRMAGPNPSAAPAARPRDDRLARDQLALALRYLRPHPWLMPVFGLTICVIFNGWIPWENLAGWDVALTLSLFPFFFVSKAFLSQERQPEEMRLWQTLACLTYALPTLVWAAQPFVLWTPHNDLDHLLIMLFLAGYLSGQSAFVGPSKMLTFVLFALDGTALVISPLREFGLVGDGLAVIGFFYALYTLYMARQIHRTARDMLSLRSDKNDLIAALGKAKAESDNARYRAEAASKAKSQFLANMSHELRTPLNSIIGFSELIASRTFAADIEKHVEYAELVNRSGHHLLALINDILDLAKIEAGALALRECEIDIGRLISDEAELLIPKVEAGGCTLSIEISENLPLVLADERAMKQVILNLLSNAAKFTPQGGCITVFAAAETGAALAFGVKDTGVGIPPEDQARIFENFGQANNSMITSDKGTGLGLPIVKGLIEAHGGRVALQSKVGKGTQVTVLLPLARARPRLSEQAA